MAVEFVFSVFAVGGLGAARLGIAIGQDFPSIFEIEKEHAVGNLIYWISNLFLSPKGRM